MSTVLALLCLSSLTLWTPADGKVFTPQLTSKIEEFVVKYIQCYGVVGLSLAVVKGNETWTRGFGMADKVSRRPVDSSTLFGLGSVTTVFTSTLLGMLMDESKSGYTWQTPVRKILGRDFRLADKYVTRHTTVKDILVHRTGLTTNFLPLKAGVEMSRENFTRCLKKSKGRLQYLPVAAPFRDEWNYNNWMYTLAGRVAEVMGGASWEELLHQRIFQPLQMNDSRVIGYNVEVDADNFALPYVWLRNDVVLSDSAIYRFTPAEPAVGIVSSADDMAKWMSFHLREGVTPDGVPLVKKETLEETYKLQMALPKTWMYVKKPKNPVTFSVFGYGFAWFLSYYRGYQVEWVAGPLPSYHSYLGLIRDVDIGVYISTTAEFDISGATQYEIFYIVDLLLGENPWQNTTTFPQTFLPCLRAPEQNATNTTYAPIVVPDLVENPQLFEGTYGNRLFGNVSSARNTSGELLVSYGRILGKLRKTNQTHVLLADIYGTLEFLTHHGDNVVYVNITFTSPGEGGQYQSLLASSNDDPLLFQRNVTFSDVADSDGTSGDNQPSSLLAL